MTWTRKEICYVACRLLILILFVMAIRMVTKKAYFAVGIATSGVSWSLFISVFILFLYMLPLVLIWRWTDSIAHVMAGHRIDAENETTEDQSSSTLIRIPETKNLLHVGITILGLFFLLQGVYYFLFSLFAHDPKHLSGLEKAMERQPAATVISSSFLIVAAVILMSGGHYLAGKLLPEREEQPEGTDTNGSPS